LKREKMSTGDGYLLVYSITDDTTFAKVDRLREEILRAQNGRMVPIFLVGTKADLKADRAVSEKERLAKARAWNCQSFEISAKTDRQGVKDVFEQMANAIVQIDSYKGMGGGGSVMGAGVTPADPLNARKKKGCSWL
jgi:Ras-related protein Rap-1B